MLISYATDVHGNTSFIESILEKSVKHKVDAIIINGDLTPDEYFMDVLAQREFFDSYLIPLFREFRKRHNIEIFVLMGNHDYQENMSVLYKAEKNKIIKALHDRIHKINGFSITGYSYINPIGFLSWEKQEPEIKKDLGKLKNRLDFKKCIFVTHAPPHKTKLDVIYGGRHVGSKAIREFIEEFQPYLCLHGHIHESPKVSGSITDNIGRSLCVNPGNAKIVLIDLDSLKINRV